MRQIPAGFMSTDAAAFALAKARSPAAFSEIPAHEKQLYEGANQIYDGRYLYTLLEDEFARRPSLASAHRMRLHQEAVEDIREWVIDGSLWPFACQADWHLFEAESDVVLQPIEGSYFIERSRANITIVRGMKSPEDDYVVFSQSAFKTNFLDSIQPEEFDDFAAADQHNVAAAALPASAYRTGAPGKPSPMRFIQIEFEARVVRGDVNAALPIEAESLREWCELRHPNSAVPSARTIENGIRKAFRRKEAHGV